MLEDARVLQPLWCCIRSTPHGFIDILIHRFCAVKLHDSCGVSVLVVSVYMPAQSYSFCFDEYLSTIGELEGFL